ncbi:MAG: DUF58 domain-containing protein [Verrucomicrobia bacterium]|nr:DUF58 domain-containing protein [Verrucomicrobiota bacterium]
MKQVAKIKVITTRFVDEFLSGEYHSVFKGLGIEFDEVREYAPGDDIRSIDWNVTARMGHPFVKRYSEERELTILFVVDTSGSFCFGTRDRSKAEVAAELTSLLALSAIKNQDKIGLILFSDRIEKSIPPRKGRTAAMRLVREVLAFEETRRGTDIASALQFLNSVQKRRAVVFLISDFIADDYWQELRLTARKHDLICCAVSDPWEEALPNVGPIEVEDPETGELLVLDTGSAGLRKGFSEQTTRERKQRLDTFRRLGIDTVPISTSQPYVDAIRQLFKMRQLRSKGR